MTSRLLLSAVRQVLSAVKAEQRLDLGVVRLARSLCSGHHARIGRVLGVRGLRVAGALDQRFWALPSGSTISNSSIVTMSPVSHSFGNLSSTAIHQPARSRVSSASREGEEGDARRVTVGRGVEHENLRDVPTLG
jgi:hypothetical protein